MRLSIWIFAGLTALVLLYGCQRQESRNSLDARVASITTIRSSEMVECAPIAQRRPLVLLVLGQSNAGNHGAMSASSRAPVLMQVGPRCATANDPLPGATGEGGSIWRHLPALLEPELAGRTVLLSLLAVDATSIHDWTRLDSVIAKRLVAQIEALRRNGMSPDIVLWQQGEADARAGTTADQYLTGLQQLMAILGRTGTPAPIMLARSTVCRSQPDAAIREAIDRAVKSNPRFLLGPDTDLLDGSRYRYDGCHLNPYGLRMAAGAWAVSLKPQIAQMLR